MRINWNDPKLISIIIGVILVLTSIFFGKFISASSTSTVISIILAIVFFIVVLVNTDAGLILLIFSMLLSPEIGAGKAPGREIIIRFEDILLAIITFTWFAKTAINKGLALFVKTPINKAMGVYILICVISTLKGAVFGTVNLAEGFFYTLKYSEYFLLFLLVVNHIHSKKQIKVFLTAIFLTCAVVSIYGILQIPSGERVSAPFEGQTGEPNTFGGYLLFILCLAVGIYLHKVPRKIKIAMAGIIIISFIPFLFTLSRASYIAIIFSFFTFIILSRKKAELITAVAVIIMTAIILRPEAIFSRVKYTFQKERESVKIGNIYLDPSASARVRSWSESIQTWMKNPIIGRGVTGFMFIDGQYMMILPELGILGLLAFLWLLWVIFKNSLNIFKKEKDELFKGLALGFLAGFIGLTIHALTANTFIIVRIMEPFWFIAGIVMMLPSLKDNNGTAEVNLSK
ncbi:MAG: O-antigen ligase family protein [Candidatus Aminicenantaceae bacterium]